MATQNAINNNSGGITVTGTANINTTGSAVSSIGTGGTGATNIGNATGNTAVTGSLTASTGLVATTGGIIATGTSNINTSGSSVTSIGTGGTGATNIGNATGNTAVTGSLTASTTLTATSGNITSTNGNHVVGNTAAATTAPFVTFQKSRSAGVITSGDILGDIDFSGHDGTGYIVSSRILCTSSGTIATNRVASALTFYTHPDSTSASTLRLTIASTGAVTIAAPDSGVGLTVSGGGMSVTGSITATTSISATTTVSSTTTMTAGTGLTVTTGNAAISSGNLTLAQTTSSIGQVVINTIPYLHAYGDSGSNTNVFVGNGCGNFTMTDNTAIANTALGYQCLAALTTGTENCGVGDNACHAVTTGTSNLGFGHNGMKNVTTGSYNTGVGVGAGSNYTSSESYNVVLGLTYGTASESNVMRLGNDGSYAPSATTSCFISGISGATVTGSAVLCATNGQLGTVVSSKRYKENINDMGEVSSDILKLRPVTFNFKKPEIKNHIYIKETQTGLIAEEVADVMPNLVIYNENNEPESVKYHELPVLLLNEMQKMLKRIETLEALLAKEN